MDFDFDKAARSPWAAGALGSVVGLRFVPGLTWMTRAFNAASGTACAGFVGPALSDWLRIEGASVQAGLAFGVGMFGLSIAVAAVEAIRAVGWADVIRGWISRRG